MRCHTLIVTLSSFERGFSRKNSPRMGRPKWSRQTRRRPHGATASGVGTSYRIVGVDDEESQRRRLELTLSRRPAAEQCATRREVGLQSPIDERRPLIVSIDAGRPARTSRPSGAPSARGSKMVFRHLLTLTHSFVPTCPYECFAAALHRRLPLPAPGLRPFWRTPDSW